MRCIIPAAGYGTRVNMKPDESKEMLPDPENPGQPMIQYCLDICKTFQMDPIVVTREHKKDLIAYLDAEQVEFQTIKPSPEWNSTVLATQVHWYENNMLILPDTRFGSFKCIEDIQRGLEVGNNAVMALHEVSDPSKWGIVHNYFVMEKPLMTGNRMAWGLIGFKKSYGQELFSEIQYLELQNVGFTYLNYFKDLTRGQ